MEAELAHQPITHSHSPSMSNELSTMRNSIRKLSLSLLLMPACMGEQLCLVGDAVLAFKSDCAASCRQAQAVHQLASIIIGPCDPLLVYRWRLVWAERAAGPRQALVHASSCKHSTPSCPSDSTTFKQVSFMP